MLHEELNAAIRDIPIPLRMSHLPISPKGFPVPWFVAEIDGEHDFRVIGPGKIDQARKYGKCWLCGEKIGVRRTFVIGPMCTVNRISAEPPCHLTCAEYAVRACPFLSKPNMRRNEVDLPEGQKPPGEMLLSNPGVTALWTTQSYSVMHDGNGVLFRLGDPEHVSWWSEGRAATLADVEEAMARGLPKLESMAVLEGQAAMLEFRQAVKRSKTLFPASVRGSDAT